MTFVRCRTPECSTRKMGVIACPIVWNKTPDKRGNWGLKDIERFVARFGKNTEVTVYGGYPRNKMHSVEGWYVSVRVKCPTNFPNKLVINTCYSKLADAQHSAIYAGLLFFAQCLIKNKKPEDMDLT